MATPRFTMHVLGSPRIVVDGVAVELERRKAVALLVYLAVTRQSHQREALATLFWPEFDQSRARNGLRRTLSVINKMTPDGTLAAERESVGLAAEADLWLDVDVFQQSISRGSRHDHTPGDLCEDCVRALEEAANLYRGDFLAGFTLRDSPAFDEWQFFQAETFRRLQAETLDRLAQHHGARGAFNRALEFARRRLQLDVLHEETHRRLMELYAQSNQRAAALRQYGVCARVLRKELGVEPQPETTLLYESIKHAGALRQAYLRVLSGPGATGGRRFPLGVQVTIGFLRANDIFLNDEFVSSWHARIDRTEGRYLLVDLGSTNGTRVNGRSLAPDVAVRLAPGDVVEIGDTHLKFEYQDEDDSGEPWGHRTMVKFNPGESKPDN